MAAAWLQGCGGGSGASDTTRGGWLGTNGTDALVIGDNSSYLLYGLNGYWETGDLQMAGGAYTFTITAALNSVGIGNTRSGTYTVSANDLHLVPASGPATDWGRMREGGRVASAAVGTWTRFGQYIRLYESGHFYYYDVTVVSLGTCTVTGGKFTFTYLASDNPALIGTTLTGTYSVSGNSCDWTPQGRATVTLTRQP